MSYRVEELAARAATRSTRSATTRPGTCSRPRLEPGGWPLQRRPRRAAGRIRRLQGRGFGLAVIRRLLAGELDRADEALIAAVAHESQSPDPDDLGDLGEAMAHHRAAGRPQRHPAGRARSGGPRRAAGPPRVQGQDRYSEADVDAAAAGLRLLEHGLPLPELLDLARDHTVAMRATSERAVALFDRYVRQALRAEGGPRRGGGRTPGLRLRGDPAGHPDDRRPPLPAHAAGRGPGAHRTGRDRGRAPTGHRGRGAGRMTARGERARTTAPGASDRATPPCPRPTNPCRKATPRWRRCATCSTPSPPVTTWSTGS